MKNRCKDVKNPLTRHKKLFITALLIVLACFYLQPALFATNRLVLHKELNTNSGLPSDYINDLVFDQEGFVWLATSKGLYRFDGNNYKSFPFPKTEEKSTDPYISHLAIVDNTIWMTLDNGSVWLYHKLLNKFDKTDLPKDIALATRQPFKFIFADRDANIWLGLKNNGLLIVDSTGTRQKWLSKNLQEMVPFVDVEDMCQDENNDFWLATSTGLVFISANFERIATIRSSVHEGSDPLSLPLQNIELDLSGYLWLGTAGQGLYRYDPATKITQYFPVESENSKIEFHPIQQLLVDRKNQLWVTTLKRLYYLNPERNQTLSLHQPNVYEQTSSSKINHIAQANSGSLWMATQGEGIRVVVNEELRFINHRMYNGLSALCGMDVVQIEADNSDQVWVVNNNSEVFVFDFGGQLLSDLSREINRQLACDPGAEAYIYAKGQKVYFGNSQHLYSIQHFQKPHKIQLELDLKKLGISYASDVFLDESGKFWFSTRSGAVSVQKEQVVERINTNDPVGMIAEDYRNMIWIGTKGSGVYIYSKPVGQVAHHISDYGDSTTLSGNDITGLFEDQTGVFWISTLDGGVCSYDRNFSNFKRLRLDQPGINNHVSSMIQPDEDYIWFATNSGLYKYNVLNGQLVFFGHDQGLHRNLFNDNSVAVNSKGELFFGTDHGVLSFEPKFAVLENNFPAIRISDIVVSNTSVLDQAGPNYLSLLNQSGIVLESYQSSLTIEFAALDMDFAHQIDYKYRLKDVDNKWIESKNNNKVSYFNLPAGDYVFELTSTNKDGIWNPNPIRLKFSIKSAFYQRIWFKILIVFTILLFVFGLIYFRLYVLQKSSRMLAQKVELKTQQLNEYNIQLKKEVEERKLAEELAGKANKSKSEFLANMSHEIRTPMNSIIGFTDLLSSLVKDEKQRYYLESIRSSGRSLLVLINDILDLSKIEAGKFEIDYQSTNLEGLITDIKQVFALKCDEKDLIFNVDCDTEIPSSLVLSDSRLRQIFINIVGNAIKFTDRGSISILTRKTGASKDASKVNIQIDIKDTGIGIPEEQQSLIFHAFHQKEGQEFNKYGGTGLGLTISKRLVELMGGKISVASKVGQGTTFSLHLNEVAVAEENEPSHEEGHSCLLHEMDLSGTKILIVDDSPNNRNLIKEFLIPTNASLIEAGNGLQAFEKAKEFLPDIIFLDIRMPVMNGLETAKALRNCTETAHIPLVAFTASITFSAPSKFQEAGFNDVLIKPVQMAEMAEVLYAQMEHKSIVALKPVNILENNDIVSFDNIKIIDLKASIEELMALNDLWEYTKSNKFVNTVLEFSRKINEIGQAHGIMSITRYSQKLTIHAESFDTLNMEATLKEYQNLVDELNSYLND